METYEFNGEKYKKASRHQKEWGTRLILESNGKGIHSGLRLRGRGSDRTVIPSGP